MEIRILGERVSNLERAQEILAEMRGLANKEGITRCLYAITYIAQGSPAAAEAAIELKALGGQPYDTAQQSPPVASLPRPIHTEEQKAAIELANRWEKSRADAAARTQQMTAAGTTYDAYASQRHRRGRKSHLAAAINQNVHDYPFMGCVWFVLFFIAIVGCMIMVAIGK